MTTPDAPPPQPTGEPASAAPAIPPPANHTSMPTVSLVLGVLSIIFPGFLLGIAAVIVGFIGRKKAKEFGQSTGTATGGIVTGFVGIALSIVTVIAIILGGLAVFGIVNDQTKVAAQIQVAEAAAESYEAANGSFKGVNSAELAQFGYTEPPGFSIKVIPSEDGKSVCVQGYKVDDPASIIHKTNLNRGSITITTSDQQFNYSVGQCRFNSH